jgi:hypothetical protein
MKKKYSFIYFLLLFFLHAPIFAWQKRDSLVAKFSSPIYKEPAVISVLPQNINPEDSETELNIPVVYPGSLIKVKITNPISLLKSRPLDTSRLILYANGVPLKGMSTDWFADYSNLDITTNNIAILKDTVEILFILNRNQTAKPAWDFFYSNTKEWYANSITLKLSVGWEGMSPIVKSGNRNTQLTIKYFRFEVFIVWLVGFVLFIILSLYMAIRTDLLRECTPNGAYSLSLTQLMFWTVLVIGAFIYTLVLTDIASTLNTSVLLLLGISLSTTGFASLIDSRSRDRDDAPCKQHRSFFKDILTHGNCYSVQRTQVVAWNLVLGVYFIFYTINNKDMPEFSPTLLFLAGISSASYLTGKLPENKTVVGETNVAQQSKSEDKAVG